MIWIGFTNNTFTEHNFDLCGVRYKKTMISSSTICWHQIIVSSTSLSRPKFTTPPKPPWGCTCHANVFMKGSLPTNKSYSSFTASLSFPIHTSTTMKRRSRLSKRLSLSWHDCCTASRPWAPLQNSLSIFQYWQHQGCQILSKRESLSYYISASGGASGSTPPRCTTRRARNISVSHSTQNWVIHQ